MFGVDTNTNGWVQVQNTSSNGVADFIINPVGGNLGLGVTPSAWGASWKSMSVNTVGALASTTGVTRLYHNAYNNDTNNIYRTTAAASMYSQDGAHSWFVAPSGTAGNNVTFTQAMTLDASGNLGIGTSSPVSNFRLTSSLSYDGTGGLLVENTSTGVSASSGTRYKNSGSTIAYTLLGGTNRASYGGLGANIMSMYTDNTAGISLVVDAAGPITFNTTATERMRIDSSGNVLVGTTDASGTVGVGFKVLGNRPVTVSSSSTDGTTIYEAYSTGASAYRFYVGMGGTVFATNTTISAISDQRLKENIRDLDEGLATVMALKPRKFDWKTGKGKDIKNDRGFIAQEIEQVLPDMVEQWRDPAPEGEEPYKAVNANLIPTLVKAIQELNAKFEAYKASHP
jgi:hypothetical protein